jgi:LPS export ABC transporter protein LptC
MNVRTVMILTLLLLVAGAGLAIWNAAKNTPPTAPVTTAKALQDDEMVAHDVSFVVTEGQIKKWKIIAETAHYNESHTNADLLKVRGEFYDKVGKPVMSFTAPKGIYRHKNHAVTLTGGVLAKTLKDAPMAPPLGVSAPASPPKEGHILDGGEIASPKMIWDAKSDWVNASGGVKLTFAKGTTTAQACRFNLDFSQLFLRGNVASAITQ